MSLTTALSLDEVANKFATWRKTKNPGEHIPHELWQQVKKISDHYRIGQITKKLRINTDQYRRYVLMNLECRIDKMSKTKAPAISNAFVKIENNLSTQNNAALRLEFVRKDGAKLNCYYPSLEELHQTVEWFVRS